MSLSSRSKFAVAAAIIAAVPLAASAAHAGTFKTINFSNGFADWTGVPVMATTSATGTPTNLATLQMANDSSNVYFLVTFSAASSIDNNPIYLGIDSDNNPATGFAIYGSTSIGSNAAMEFYGGGGYVAFTQTATSFNSGGSFTSSGNSVLANSYPTGTGTQSTSEFEFSMPLNLMQTDTSAGGFNGKVFADSFTTELYTSPSTGSASVIGPVTYSLASAVVPEPAPGELIGLGLIGALGLVSLKRLKRAC
jgi:hypothetical protein